MNTEQLMVISNSLNATIELCRLKMEYYERMYRAGAIDSQSYISAIQVAYQDTLKDLETINKILNTSENTLGKERENEN